MDIPKLFLIPLIAGIFAQFCKLVVQTLKGNPNWRVLISYGGMPSSHSAAVASLTTVIAIYEGIHSPLFAICLIFSSIILIDAVGYRRILGKHSEVLNHMIAHLPQKEEKRYPKHLREHLGHTPWQVLVGILIGIIITFFLYLIIP
jgi:hypothetical protein